jgi:hypothetical protein
MVKFFLPGSRVNAARHFLCRTPASVDVKSAAHAADDDLPSLAASSFRSITRTETRSNLPTLIVGMSPLAAAL